MQLTLMAFGKIAEITGSAQLAVPGVATTTALRTYLEATYPALRATKYAVAVNKQIIKEDTALPEGATVALLPPFSGG